MQILYEKKEGKAMKKERKEKKALPLWVKQLLKKEKERRNAYPWRVKRLGITSFYAFITLTTLLLGL